MRRLRLVDEDGIALVLAVLIMAILTITVISVISYTSANARDASSKKAEQQAYALAEGGLSNAFAQLASHYYDASGNTIDSTTVYDASWSIAPTAACATSSCSTWGVTSWSPVASGQTKGTVTLWGKGQVANPGGPNLATITRTVSAKIDVTQPPAVVTAPPIWQMVYSGGTGNPCDYTLPQGTAITAPLYVAGNLCGTQNGAVSQPATLVVGGNVTLSQKAAIGTSSAPLSSLTVVGSCTVSGVTTTPCQINQSGGKVWADPSGVHTSTTIASPVSQPSVDWSNAQLDYASNATCSPSSVVLSGTFNLTPQTSGSDYSCTTDSGSISWSESSEKLTVAGNVYINGDLNIDTKNNIVTYTGMGNIYVAGDGTLGEVTFANNSYLCVASKSGDCNFNDLSTWDTTKNLLIILAHSNIAAKNLHLQGGLYSDTLIDLGSGQTETQGPLVSPQLINPAQQAAGSFPSISVMESGPPGTSDPPFQLGKPYGGSY